MARKFMRRILIWLPVFTLAAASLWRSTRHAGAPEKTHQSLSSMRDGDPTHDVGFMPKGFARLFLSWVALLLLGGAEFAVSFLDIGRSLRPLVMIPGVLMVGVVAINFMEVAKGPSIVRGFAVAAMFWLIVLLGLGSIDPLTRVDYLVPHAHVK